MRKLKLLLVAMLILGVSFVGYKLFSTKKEKTIHIAMAGPLTGENARVGKSFRQGINLYLEKINAKGGVNGRQIVLEEFDDQNSPGQARERAYEIIHQTRVVGVIGHHFSSCSLMAGELYRDYGVPAITPASTNVRVTRDNDWYFRSSFNDNLQGRFLANYAHQVFKYKTATIIHEDQDYGAYLARVFENTAKSLGMEIKYKWNFDAEGNLLDQQLDQIVNELKTKKDAGVIFISSHAMEGAKLIRLIKDAMISNPIIAPDAFASKSFQNAFAEYPRERSTPGFYTNGIYVTTPLIFDTTNEKGLQFWDAYKAKYREEPDWHAAFAYDSAMVLVEAIKATKVEGKKSTVVGDRKKIRDWLAGLTNAHDAIEGVTGYNYFDENRDSQKPIFIGVYRNQNIISALIQFQGVQNVYRVPNFEDALMQERVVIFDGRHSYKINVVYTGIRMNEITELKPKEFSCVLDFYLWFRYHGSIDVQNVEFTNALEPIQMGAPVQEIVKDQITYRLYHIKGKFRMDFLPNQHIFGKHILGVSFRPRNLDRNNLIFVKDILGMRLTEGRVAEDKMNRDQVLSPSFGWRITDAWFFQDIVEKDSLGDPEYLVVERGTLEYSRFNAGIRIEETQFTIRRTISDRISGWLLFASIVMTLLLHASVHDAFPGILPNLKPFSKLAWMAQSLFAGLLLLSAEVYILKYFSDRLTTFSYQAILMAFGTLWWLVPAHFITMGFDRFIWNPLEVKSGRSIPKIIRNLVALVIYILAIFGVIAFVFDQKLTSLLATSGVIAMIIGLAIQMNIANIFSGIAINIERPFRVGDWVKIGTYNEGKVIDMNWRATRIQTRDDTVISIPNSKASESQIENFSLPTDCYWKYFTVHVDPIHSPERVKKILLDAAMATEFVLPGHPPSTRFLGLTAGMTGQSESWAANYLISIYVQDYGKKFAHNEAVWMNVWRHLRLAGIRHVMTRNEVNLLFEGIKPKAEKVSKTHEILQEIDIFKPFSENAKAYLSQRMRSHSYPADQIIVKQGDAGDSLFIIVEGVLRVFIRQPSGKEIDIARLGAGNFFGEMALMTGEHRTATIVAMTDARLYEITKADIMPIMKEYPEVTGPLSEVLSLRRMAMQSKMVVEEDEKIDKDTLASQILHKMKQFFGFK